MNEKKKSRNRENGAAANESFPDYTDNDPLIGWFSLGKQSRIERKPKRGWQRGGHHGKR
ncbi:MAG: hypothetical protein LBT71_00585 [Azoarcus sp.]|nr:hypothetical protein [Azoarcus sp.]